MREGKKNQRRSQGQTAIDLTKCHPESLTYSQRKLIEQTLRLAPVQKNQVPKRRRTR